MIEKNVELITNSLSQTYELIKELLSTCKSFKFNVSFITWGGYQILAQTLEKVHNKNIKGQILTTSYQEFNDPKILQLFLDNFDNFEMKVVDQQTIFENKISSSFHPKGYIFEFNDCYKIIIGSVNMTEKAMKTNVEWSILIKLNKDDILLENILNEFEFLWKNTNELDQEFIDYYQEKYINEKKNKLLNYLNLKNNEIISPNHIQKEALKNLNNLRTKGENKALIIAATGVGKTFLSAFDVQQFNPKKLLFVVHREEILKKSEETFKKIFPQISTTIFNANKKDVNPKFIFASHQSLHRNLELFKPNEFDYIIIDEAHHIRAKTYLKILEYFKPKFLLGMTATPERMDGENIFELFDGNIALEIRLKEAINQNLISTFHYFGISDISSVDLTDIDIDDIDKISKKLMINERVDYVIKQINLYKYDGSKMYCLGFCASIEHAKYMSEQFNKRGICSEYIVSELNFEQRQNIINKFQDENDPLSIIFVVDIFNEGIDIPKVNLVLFLRPTNSPIIFLQQLGRGLRKDNEKTFLTVLDFIANHNKTYLIPYAMASFNNVINEVYIQDMIKQEFKSIPEFHIEFDEISKERILNSFNKIDFNSKKWIKNEYLEFKKIRDNKVPYLMCDYLIDGAPDILKIINKSNYKNYLLFLFKMENSEEIFQILKDEKFILFYQELSNMLPIYRINEFILINELVRHEKNINIDEASKIINNYTKNTDIWSVENTFKFFNGDFLDPKDNIKIIDINNNEMSLNKEFKKILEKEINKKYILDCLEYGIQYFLQNYNLDQYQFPFIKIGQKYKMKEILSINQDHRKYSSLFGQGIYKLKNNFYFFIDLIKDENNKFQYKDEIKSRNYIIWSSPDSMNQSSKQAIEIINHKELGFEIHVFIRKYGKIKNISQPFTYIGKVNVENFKENNPIIFKLKLENPLNDEIYYQLKK